MADTNIKSLRNALRQKLEEYTDILSLLIATPDGHCLEAFMQDSSVRGKMAAMSSSLIAVAEGVSELERLGHCKHLVIEGVEGFATVRRMPNTLLLVLTASQQTNMGYVIHFSRECEHLILKHRIKK